jgi:hypothetical protein
MPTVPASVENSVKMYSPVSGALTLESGHYRFKDRSTFFITALEISFPEIAEFAEIQPTFRRNMPPQHLGLRVSQTKIQDEACSK